MTHLQALIDAVALGSTYALIAVGIGLVFGVMRLINFAYGQLIMVGAYALVFTSGSPDVVSILVAFGVVIALSLVMERVAFRPLRTASPSTMLVATFAIAFLLQSIALLRYSLVDRPFGDTADVLATLNQPITFGDLHVRKIALVSIGATAATLVLLALLLNRTNIGLQMRAAAADFHTARLLGVKSNSVITLSVVLSGVLATIAAIILVVQTPLVTPDYGLKDTIIVLVGVVVGGLDRLLSAMLGGFAIGFATSFLGAELQTQGSQDQAAWPFTASVYLDSVVFVLVILVLVLRPAGLFARRGQQGVTRL